MDSFLTIKNQIEKTTFDLLKAANQLCYNIFSENILYIERLVREEQKFPFLTIKKRRYKDFKKNKTLSIDELALEIEKLQLNISWIDFILYFSSDIKTIIIVELICKKDGSKINYHGTILTPPDFVDPNTKFDINWHLEAP